MIRSWTAACLRWLRRFLFTRENAWAILLAFVIVLIWIMSTSGTQPRFIYGNF